MSTLYVNCSAATGGNGTTNNESSGDGTHAYKTLAAAVTGIGTTTLSEPMIIKCSAGSANTADGGATFSNITTSAANYLQIEANTDQEALLTGWSDSRYRATSTAASGTLIFQTSTQHVRLRNLQVKQTRASSSSNCVISLGGSSPGEAWVTGCRIEAAMSGTATNSQGILGSNVANVYVQNCVFVGPNLDGASRSINAGDGDNRIYAYNNTFADADCAINETSGSAIVTAKNNIFTRVALTAPTAPTAALAGAGAGNVTNGTHSWKVTFVGASGLGRSQAGAASNQLNVTDNTTNGQVSLTSVPLGPTGTSARNIYRTVAGDTGNYKYVGQVADNTTTTFTDNVADGSLGADQPTPKALLNMGATHTYNFSDQTDTSLDGTGEADEQTFDFVSSTDFTLEAAIAGTDLSADGNWVIDTVEGGHVDMAGVTRSGTWDAGASEYAAVANAITVTSPATLTFYQQDGSNEAGIPISGTYSGTPANIEADFAGGGYATISAAPGAGENTAFSGTLTGQAAGVGTLTVRFSDDTGTNDTVANVGIGDVIGGTGSGVWQSVE